MPNRIERLPQTSVSYALATTAGAAGYRIGYGNVGGGMFYVTAGSAGTITWYVGLSSDPSSTTYAAIGSSGSAVTTSIDVGKAYPIPDDLFGAHFIIPVSSVSGVSVTITAKG